jgi:hypothetical protein
MPKGFCADHPAAELFTEIEKRFRALTPFLEFLNAPLAGKRRVRDENRR